MHTYTHPYKHAHVYEFAYKILLVHAFCSLETSFFFYIKHEVFILFLLWIVTRVAYYRKRKGKNANALTKGNIVDVGSLKEKRKRKNYIE